MLKPITAFTGFSVNNLEKAKHFYTEVIGLELDNEKMGLTFRLPKGGAVFVYPKDNHEPATYTVLDLVVEDIDAAVSDLKSHGVELERYEGAHQGEDGIARSPDIEKYGPTIAWIKDPAGNVIALIQKR